MVHILREDIVREAVYETRAAARCRVTRNAWWVGDLWIALSLTVRVRPARTCLSPEEAGGPVAQHAVFRQGDHQVFGEGGGRVACPMDGTIWEVRQILAPDICCRVVKTA